MHEYRIFETDQFRRDLRSLARAGHQEIVRKLRRSVYPQLREHPHFGPHVRKLKHYEPETWRYQDRILAVLLRDRRSGTCRVDDRGVAPRIGLLTTLRLTRGFDFRPDVEAP